MRENPINPRRRFRRLHAQQMPAPIRPDDEAASVWLYWDREPFCEVLLPSSAVEPGLSRGLSQLLSSHGPALRLSPKRLDLSSLPCRLVAAGSLRCRDVFDTTCSKKYLKLLNLLCGIQPQTGVRKAVVSHDQVTEISGRIQYQIYILPPMEGALLSPHTELECKVAIHHTLPVGGASPFIIPPTPSPQNSVPVSPQLQRQTSSLATMTVHPYALESEAQAHSSFVLGGELETLCLMPHRYQACDTHLSSPSRSDLSRSAAAATT